MSKSEFLSTIVGWCRQAKLKTTRVEDLNADFHLVVSEPNLPSIEVIHPQLESAFVVLIARVALADDIQKKLLEHDMKARREVFREARMKLLSRDIEFGISGGEDEVPRVFELFSRIFVRDNTIQSFWEAYVRLKSAVVMISTIYRDFTGSAQLL